ncbi:MAG: hypothetical protein U5K38_00745 [Woeseiaceae bacterium]|nr:hypothetical protein [Woeseiaceae bacterium]
MEQILASHPDVQAGGELPFARDCEYRFRVSRVTAGRDGPVNPADPVDAELLESARERYLDALFERGLDGPWIIDKLPGKLRDRGFPAIDFSACSRHSLCTRPRMRPVSPCTKRTLGPTNPGITIWCTWHIITVSTGG